MKTILSFFYLLFIYEITDAWFYGRPGPGDMTFGEVWPLPQHLQWNNYNHTLHPDQFQFLTDFTPVPDVVASCIKKYKRWSFPDAPQAATATLKSLKIQLKTNPGAKAPYPQFGMDESYTLTINSSQEAILEANEVWGVVRGLDTFSQLVWQPESGVYKLKAATIKDFPRFPHRAIMLDTSRHFLTVPVIKRNIDLMAQNKFNVFHWHIVDSEAFPYTSEKFPDLTKGAYTPIHKYTIKEMKEVVEYAKLRGIRVVAEFDTPGHMGSWEPGKPGILAKCYYKNKTEDVLRDIIDPSKPENFQFLKEFFTEALALFPDRYMHFGGDEVIDLMEGCWRNNDEVAAWMEQNGYGDDIYAVLNDYWHQLIDIINEARNETHMIVWQEVLDMNVNAPNAIAHVWRGWNYDEVMEEMALVTKNGHYTILSSCWYLNYFKYGPDWGYIENNVNIQLRGLYYQCEPTDFNGTDAQKELVLGGEAVMWAEMVDGTNLVPRLWPRASAVAERLWSNKNMLGTADEVWPRLHEHRCRMLRRGYPAQPPNNPDYCPQFWDPQYDDIP